MKRCRCPSCGQPIPPPTAVRFCAKCCEGKEADEARADRDECLELASLMDGKAITPEQNYKEQSK